MIIRGFRRSRWRGSRIAVDHCAFPIGWHGYWPQRVFNKRIEIKTIVLVSLAVGQAAQSNRTLFFLGWLTILSRYSYAPRRAAHRLGIVLLYIISGRRGPIINNYNYYMYYSICLPRLSSN
jgi:hypothetical protein